MHLHVAAGHERHGEERAAGADHAAHEADERTDSEQRWFSGKLARRAWRPAPHIIRAAATHVTVPKIAAITRIGSALAICAPISEPSTSPGAIALTIGHATAPRS